jgi:2-haloacid dehalogenase
MIDFRRYRFLTFDCYGTLIDWEKGIFAALRPILSAHGKEVEDSELLELFGGLEVEAERGQYRSYREVLRAVVRGLGQKLRFTPSTEEEDSLPSSVSRWKPWHDSVQALDRLKARYGLVIVSNIDDDMFTATARQLQVKFDNVITAQQARCYKPSPAIFHLAFERTGAQPAEVLHVGQSIYHDVIPAKSLGMDTVWVNRPSTRPGVGAVIAASGQPDLEVTSLAALADAALT